jgi:diguanylate cyclase (GGDEF)-like protein
MAKGTVLSCLLALLLVASGTIAATPSEGVLSAARELAAQNPMAALELLDKEIPELESRAVAGPELAPLLHMRAELLRGAGQFERARADIERYGELVSPDGDPDAAGEVLFMLGTLEAEQGRLGQALDLFHQARQQVNQGDDANLQARVYNALGITLNFAGDEAGARDYFERALEIARGAGEQRLVATLLSNLAAVLTVLESPQAGIALYREAIAIAEQQDRTTFVALQRGLLCEQLLALGNLNEAERYCGEALPVLEAAGEIRHLAGLLMVVGDLAAARGDTARALEHYERSLVTAGGLVPSVELDVLEKLAELQAAARHWQPAVEAYQRLAEHRARMRAQERDDLIRELEVAFQLEHRDKEIEMLRLRDELQTAQISQRNAFLLVLLIGLGLAVLSALGAWRAYRDKARLEQRLGIRNAELEQALEKISELARLDSLTGLLNRRALEEVGWQEIWRAKRTLASLALVVADVDFFKQLNDAHGHVVGDEVLQQVAARLRESFRDIDLLARWGGEEFVLLLPDSTPEQAIEALERLRADLAAHPFQTSVGPIRLTMSFGVSEVQGDLDQAIDQADRAMYQAKQEGRDCIVVWAPAPD